MPVGDAALFITSVTGLEPLRPALALCLACSPAVVVGTPSAEEAALVDHRSRVCTALGAVLGMALDADVAAAAARAQQMQSLGCWDADGRAGQMLADVVRAREE